ncbi:MAG: hypothetical protein DIZ78_17175 [endosymbiont of Escarpia spicata]|uniref:DUF6603 domain-containing protein n=1 Tax=endosymbiont of Escarpia spicata TaxID=2200908 RepID=A0A370DCY4_9GAMM|nr:MAG: hypothetical protein DIZ78_17175 [endosymbiont of Escarpia spicata]
MPSQSTTQALLTGVAWMFEPLAVAAQEEQPAGLLRLVADAGLDPDDIEVDDDQLIEIVAVIDGACTPLSDLLATGQPPSPTQLPAFIDALGRLLEAVRGLDGLPGYNGGPGLGWLLLNYLLTHYLRNHQPGLLGILELTGVIILPPTPLELALGLAEAPQEGQPLLPQVDFGKLGRWLGDPGSIMRDTFLWDDASLKQYELLFALERLLLGIGIPVFFTYPTPSDAQILGTDPERDNPDAQLHIPLANIERAATDGGQIGGQAGLAVLPLPGNEQDPLPGFAFVPFGVGGASEVVDLGDQWTLSIQISADAPSRYAVVLRPSGVQVASLLEEDQMLPSFGAQLAITRSEPDGERRLLLGDPEGVALWIGTLGLLVDFELDADGEAEFALRLPIRGARLQIDVPERYGFLSSVLPEEGLAVDFDITIGWSSTEGLAFDGSATLDIALPLHLSLGGVVDIRRIGLGIGVEEGGGLLIGADASASLNLGPFNAVVERIGLETRISFPANGNGNFGPVSLDIGLKPPEGMGISLDGGLVSGGGTLVFDPENGRYAGVLALDIFEISLTAIGLLDTRRSDGGPLPSPGFSFLVIISGEFPPIQLSFVFALTGAGGLIGIHRSMALEALQNGIRNGSTDPILFPEDPQRNMPQIISDVRNFFPVQPGRYVFGPMARLSWGTPRLIDAELGIFLEVPDPILLVLLGQISAALPDENNPIVSLHVDVLGILDFANERLAVDASLRDSQINGFPIYGDMALRLSWGGKPNFALAIGGFNPHFRSPPNFPTLKPITVSLGNEDNPRITLQGYMAITSNTIQFGARAELYAAAGPASLEGYLSFHALLILDPFYFRADFEQIISFRLFGETLAGVAIIATLSGPAPYRIRGRACVSILFADICIAVDVTVGERSSITLAPKDVWEPLDAAIRDPRNWSATLPDGVYAGVSLKAPEGEDIPLMVHPMGRVTMRQKVVPLSQRLEKFGELAIIGDDYFEIRSIRVGNLPPQSIDGDECDWETVADWFAPGQFEQLSDDEKLSRDSFEPMVAGVTVGSRQMVWGGSNVIHYAPIEYETETIDAPAGGITVAPVLLESARATRLKTSRPVVTTPLGRDELLAMCRRGAKAQSLKRRAGSGKHAVRANKHKAFTLKEESYQIVNTKDMAPLNAKTTPLSKAAARNALAALLIEHPEQAGRWQVVSKYEWMKAS